MRTGVRENLVSGRSANWVGGEPPATREPSLPEGAAPVSATISAPRFDFSRVHAFLHMRISRAEESVALSRQMIMRTRNVTRSALRILAFD